MQGSRGDQRGDQCQVDSNSVSVLVDHFSAFSLVGRARPHTRGQATKRMLAAVFAPPPRVNDDWALNLVLMDDTEAAFKVCFHEQIVLPFHGEMKILYGLYLAMVFSFVCLDFYSWYFKAFKAVEFKS